MEMNELQIFENVEFGSVRTLMINDAPYFVGKDVAEILGYTNSSKALSDHVDDEDKLNNESLSSLGQRGGWLINESGLYSLILSSKMPNAKKFKNWVTAEVLPSIRKHGAYMTPETLEAAILNPDTMIQLCMALKDEQQKNKALQAANSELTVEVQIMQPKADYFDELVDRNLLTNFRETAKQLNIKEKEFISFLLEKRYVYRDKRGKLQPYAEKNKGLFEIKEFVNEKTGFSSTQTLITPKGRETFRLLMV
jgi:prophage antirepressor-like protein